jgi:hypothetical protein
LISAAWGVWIAFDKPAAWTKFWLIVGGLAIYSLLARVPERIRIRQLGEVPVLKWILGSLPGKVPALDPAMRWFAAWQPNLAGLRLNSNVIGGVIAALLPLQIAALLQNRTRRRTWIGAVLIALSGLGLLMSASRGAWLALAFVLVAWAARPTTSRWRTALWASAVGAVLAALVLFLVLTPLGERLLALRTDRLSVWSNSLDLAGDYAFTGLGLGNFEMAYSSYALLVHVGHTVHAHNLYLDVWLEHGLLGLLALAGLLVTAAWPRPPSDRWTIAAHASLAVILLHGLTDDAFYGYGGRGVLLLFVPLAVLARSLTRPRFAPALLLWGATVFALMIALFAPDVRAAWQANWGAVSQTQAELSVYRWPEWPIQDALRRSDKINLAPAITRYQSALALNPANATAHRRLGQIELALGEYELAQDNLQAAYDAAPNQRATRQLLGESYAIAGEAERAAILWRTIDTGQGQLQTRVWWYAEYLQDQERAARMSRAVASLNK